MNALGKVIIEDTIQINEKPYKEVSFQIDDAEDKQEEHQISIKAEKIKAMKRTETVKYKADDNLLS